MGLRSKRAVNPPPILEWEGAPPRHNQPPPRPPSPGASPDSVMGLRSKRAVNPPLILEWEVATPHQNVQNARHDIAGPDAISRARRALSNDGLARRARRHVQLLQRHMARLHGTNAGGRGR